jgi:hypothetical protein
VGSKYQCRDHSFILGTRILWSVTVDILILISQFQFIALATTLATLSEKTFFQGALLTFDWGFSLVLTSFVLSISVNALVTGLIVFKIFKVSLKVNAGTTSVERTLGTGGGTQLRHVIFIIIESGMALFAVQLARVVLYSLQSDEAADLGYTIFIGVNQMFNVIIKSVHF